MRIFTADVPELERYLSLEDAKLRQELVSLRWRKTDVKALHFLEKRYDLMLTSLRKKKKSFNTNTPTVAMFPGHLHGWGGRELGGWGPGNKPTGVDSLAVIPF